LLRVGSKFLLDPTLNTSHAYEFFLHMLIKNTTLLRINQVLMASLGSVLGLANTSGTWDLNYVVSKSRVIHNLHT
jgi:hypothetical protein